VFCNGCGARLVVTCALCGATPPPDSRFCNGCGATLGVDQSAAPGQTAPPRTQAVSIPERDPRAYTPKHLADKILQSRSALEGERKQVTVLFADVKNSMEMAEQLDPEEWHKILERFFEILTEGVHRFEGTVNQYTGDGIMALFGAPIAHEDHAQRACYAALHLQGTLREYAEELKRKRGLVFAARIGLNSGEVIVGRIGDDLRMDYTAQGHVVGLAQRVESLADPGKTYVAAATAQLAQGYFALRDLGEFVLKGAAAPQHVFELEGPGALRTRFDVSRARGLSRFVGRATEVATLESALDRAFAGQGSVVGVVAEPGTGKSRLCFELTERARGRGISVREAHGVPHGKQVPFLPVLALLRGLFGIGERDSDAEARQKIAGALVLMDAAFERSLPVWFDFLGVPDPARPAPDLPADDRERLVHEGVRRLIRARSERGPGLILLEDLHWFDAASERLLATLVDAMHDTRTLLLLNFRPEFHAEWMQRSGYQQLPLRPLAPRPRPNCCARCSGRIRR
jgi:class 3 adenylate cyclase